jgi:hypothetical protein
MPRVNASALQVGMKVEADVRNSDDMLLIPAGCELTERHLTILESWGIAEIQATLPEGMEDPSDPLSRLEPAELETLTTEVRARFWEIDEKDPAAMEIFQVMLRRHARRHAARPPA